MAEETQTLNPSNNPTTPSSSEEWFELPEAPGGRLAEYPYDGQVVVLAGEGQRAEAHWRVSRAFDRRQLKWENIGFWAARNSGGVRVGFEPEAFRKFEEAPFIDKTESAA